MAKSNYFCFNKFSVNLTVSKISGSAIASACALTFGFQCNFGYLKIDWLAAEFCHFHLNDYSHWVELSIIENVSNEWTNFHWLQLYLLTFWALILLSQVTRTIHFLSQNGSFKILIAPKTWRTDQTGIGFNRWLELKLVSVAFLHCPFCASSVLCIVRSVHRPFCASSVLCFSTNF